MSLIKPVEIVAPEELSPVHFIAIGGVSMSSIAELFADRGMQVSGCDNSSSPVLERLADKGIQVSIGHDPSHLNGIRGVVVSSAINTGNPELQEANRRGLPIWHRSAALASLMRGKSVISVAGTHGKTSTTGMISVILSQAGMRPSYAIGAPLADTGESAVIDDGRWFVVEADESDGSFLQYPTEIAVITNVEADHLDNWGTAEKYATGFVRFATADSVHAVVLDGDDPGARALAAELKGRKVITYGESADCDVRITGIDTSDFRATAILLTKTGEYAVRLNVPGRHNLHNAAGAFAAALLAGLTPEQALSGLAEFRGTMRRFQPVGEASGIRIFDDYAHHPTELRAALTAARQVAAGSRVVACFQPHLFTRTRDFADDFGDALTLADVIVLTDIYPAREAPIPGVSGETLVDAVRKHSREPIYVADKADLPLALSQIVESGDLVLTLGAGDITKIGPQLLDLLQSGN